MRSMSAIRAARSEIRALSSDSDASRAERVDGRIDGSEVLGRGVEGCGMVGV